MDRERFEKGLAVRKAVLGAEHVERSFKTADDFTLEFEEVVTEFCWGLCWSDETLERKQRSLLNLGMLAALNRMPEWELHFRGALANGLTKLELRAVLMQVAVYCGIPTASGCFSAAKKVLAELETKR